MGMCQCRGTPAVSAAASQARRSDRALYDSQSSRPSPQQMPRSEGGPDGDEARLSPRPHEVPTPHPLIGVVDPDEQTPRGSQAPKLSSREASPVRGLGAGPPAPTASGVAFP
jgi:hypothetical protein